MKHEKWRAMRTRFVGAQKRPESPGESPQRLWRAGALEHPNLIPLDRMDVEPRGIAMASANPRGGSLADRLERGERFSASEAISILAALSDALACAHANGMAHGEVCASRVVFSGAGEPLLGGLGRVPFSEHSAAADVQAVVALGRAMLDEATDGAHTLRRLFAEAQVARPDALALARALRRARDGQSRTLRGEDRSRCRSRRDAERDHRRSRLGAIGSILAGGGLIALSVGLFVLDDGPSPMAVAGGRTPSPVASSDCPAVESPYSADFDGDGCAEAADRIGNVLQIESSAPPAVRRYELGMPGDTLVLGDWDCDRRAEPALYRPGDGRVFVFEDWATAASGITATARPTGVVGGRPIVSRAAGTCDDVVVLPGPTGTRTRTFHTS